MSKNTILIDNRFCTVCNSCLYKCIQENRTHDPGTRGFFRTMVYLKDGGQYHKRCMHCKEPACVAVCPVNALTKSAYGPVLYDSKVCIGCQQCVSACPFNIPQYDAKTQKIVKCSLCAHRIGEGKDPACVEVCPTGALMFGEYDEMVSKAKDLAAKNKLSLYGLQENGGTHVLVLTMEKPAALGYPQVGPKAVVPKKVGLKNDLKVPIVAGIALAGLKKLSDRKKKIAEEKAGKENE